METPFVAGEPPGHARVVTAEVAGCADVAGGEWPLSSPNANTNGVHQRRRVNPESLALRLGPDLVRDLDALITPGTTEMPSFAVRKELQERYSIDRRHVYDYFHSRGLRVVKEDKHGNPVPAKSDLHGAKPLPNLRPLRQAPTKSARFHSPYAVAAERNLLKPRGITKAKRGPGRPKKQSSASPKIVPAACETHESTDTGSVSEHCSPVATPKPTYVAVNPLFPCDPLPPLEEEDESFGFNSVMNPLDESFSVRRAIGDIAYAYRHKLVFERMRELTEHPVKLAPTDDRSLLWRETLPCFASSKGLLLPHAKPLTRDERHAVYESLSDSIGPVQGIQERQGTYRKHMEARAKLYFEGLLSVSCHYTQPSSGTSTAFDQKPSLGTSEFRHWLSETRFLRRDDVYGAPRLHPRHRNANVMKRQDVDGEADKRSGQGSVPHWLQTLDDLFPAPRESLCSDDPLTDSPILRTREAARTTVPADECNAGDWPPLLVTSVPGLSVFPVTSTAQVRQTGQPLFHGPSGVPGSEEVETRMSAVERDSRPQRPEHEPHPEQQPAPSGALRGGRTMSTRIHPTSCSPRNPHIRDLNRTRTRPVTSRDARRRTTSAAGDI